MLDWVDYYLRRAVVVVLAMPVIVIGVSATLIALWFQWIADSLGDITDRVAEWARIPKGRINQRIRKQNEALRTVDPDAITVLKVSEVLNVKEGSARRILESAVRRGDLLRRGLGFYALPPNSAWRKKKAV